MVDINSHKHLADWRLAGHILKVAFWLRRHQTRRALAELEPFQLEDIGLTEAQRAREVRKWFWKR